MTTHFKPANTAIQEMKPWNLEEGPIPLELSNPSALYAVIMVMAGDSTLQNQVLPDLSEMRMGVKGGDEISVLVLADLGGEAGAHIFEITGEGRIPLFSLRAIDTGDPRPIADFLAAALAAYSKETRIALGFWGHGNGVFLDLDPHENLLPEELLEMPLGTRITEPLFLKHYLTEPVAIKSLFNRGMLPDETTGGILTNRELSSALMVAFSKAGREEPVDLIFFDTCQNGSIEVYAEMRRYCKVFVASCLAIPGLGWNYTWFLQMTRRYLPDTPENWAGLAIRAYNKTYDQKLYPQPVQLAAISSDSEILEKLKAVAEKCQELTPEEYQNLWMMSGRLPAIAHNETVDVCAMMIMLEHCPGRDELKKAAGEFTKAYSDALVSVSDPPNNGTFHSGLSIWCPRLGDRVSVSKYYQNLRFHRETGWFEAVRRIWLKEKPAEKKVTQEFAIVGVQGPELVEEREVTEAKSAPTGYEEGRFLSLKILPESRPWSGCLKEGVYKFKNYETVVFPRMDQAENFIKLLKSFRRKEEEFGVLEAALEHDMVLDTGSAKRLVYELTKYEIIALDEFPDVIETYSTIRELAQRAAKDGFVLIGKNRG